MELSAIEAKLRKLIAMRDGAKPGDVHSLAEAEVAAKMIFQISEKYRIEIKDLPEVELSATITEESLATFAGAKFSRWIGYIAVGIEKAHHLRTITMTSINYAKGKKSTTKKMFLVGMSADIATGRYMLELLVRGGLEAWKRYKATTYTRGTDRSDFLKAYASRIQARYFEMVKTEQAVTSTALVVVDQKIDAYYKQRFSGAKAGRKTRLRGSNASQAGFEAGNGASLNANGLGGGNMPKSRLLNS